MSDIVFYLAQFIAVAFVLSFHEFAHAYVAYKCGDPTAKYSGRMTVNPMKHFDVLGLIMFAFAGFGWAKPVPVNPNNFNNYKKGTFLTSAAGIFMNYFMAFLLYPILILVLRYVCPLVQGTYMELFLYYLFFCAYSCSLSFCVFNLLPFYPLDGFRMIDALKKRRGKGYWFLYQYGYYILLGLIVLHLLASRISILGYFDILGYVMNFAINILGKPIVLLWDWVLGFLI